MEFRAKMNGDKNLVGYLVFNENQVEFHEDFSLKTNGETIIPTEQIEEINIQDTSSEQTRTSLTRWLLGGWQFALLFPKREFKAASVVEITTAAGDYFYFELADTALEVRRKTSPIIQKYFN
jgi:hypothetical protein